AKQLDPRERVGLAGEEQHRAADGGPMRDAGLRILWLARRMERVAEQDEGGVGRVWLGGGEAGDATTEGMTTDGDVGVRRHDQVEGGECLLCLALRKVDGPGIDTALAKPVDEGLHARGRAACAVPEVAAKAHGLRVSGGACVRSVSCGHDRIAAALL